MDVINATELTGNVADILTRKNELIRPAVANIDQTLVVFASLSPAPNFNLLSRFLVMMDYQEIPTIICFNKSDQVSAEELKKLTEVFEGSGARIIVTSVVTGEGMEELREALKGKTTSFAGPSGVGKSSILNEIFPDANSKTGNISEKINRGKHTTRHSEIFYLGEDTYIMDTPGFTSLDYNVVEADSLHYYFGEFEEYEGQCRFNGCVHINEPDCAVKTAVEEGVINSKRYDIYSEMYKELKEKRKY
jgi:ribosome biogenesis GTPase